jgi:hypothetical protein
MQRLAGGGALARARRRLRAPFLALRNGRITAYATAVTFWLMTYRNDLRQVQFRLRSCETDGRCAGGNSVDFRQQDLPVTLSP